MKKIWKDIFNSSTKNGISVESNKHIEEIIDIFVENKIDPQTFMSNWGYLLLKSGILSMYDFFREKKQFPPIPTLSVKQAWASPAFRIPAVPLWFYATFPDVMIWFDSKKQEIARKHEGDLKAESKEMLKKLWGANIKTPNDITQVLNKEGEALPKLLGQLVSRYKDETGNSLETSVKGR